MYCNISFCYMIKMTIKHFAEMISHRIEKKLFHLFGGETLNSESDTNLVFGHVMRKVNVYRVKFAFYEYSIQLNVSPCHKN